MQPQWAREIRDACIEQGVAFFHKQGSGYKTEMHTALEHEDGSTWQYRQFPDEVPFAPPLCIQEAA
jgi:protein gp37